MVGDVLLPPSWQDEGVDGGQVQFVQPHVGRGQEALHGAVGAAVGRHHDHLPFGPQEVAGQDDLEQDVVVMDVQGGAHAP
ncbi:hypothetical protein AOA80_11500 [Methanomassiliicoccales archaeon RumEn M1]|nr:hypothetical protein AOA80_11500 [Methanomassiliicoccales archaeon RumEn M1]